MERNPESAQTRRTRVVFIQRSVPPDPSAAGRLLLDLASGLDPRRFDVVILATRVPTDAPREESIGSVRIVRTGWLGFSRASLVGRLFGLLGAWGALAWGAVRVGPMDVVVTLTDPPLAVVIGAVIARLRGCRHVHWAQDVYPGVAAAGGVLRQESAAYRLLEAISESATRSCDGVVAIGRCMAGRLARRGVRARVIPNWTRFDTAGANAADAAEYRRMFDAEGRMLVLYSGNLGIVHDFDTLLDAAELLGARDANVVFGIAGDGPRGAWMRGEVGRRELGNVRFLPVQPWERFPSLLAAADAHVVTLRPEFGGLVVPSKFYDAAASGRPILFVGPENSEAALAIRECGCGAVIANGAAGGIADCVERWSVDAAGRESMGKNAEGLSARFMKTDAVREFARLLAGAEEWDGSEPKRSGDRRRQSRSLPSEDGSPKRP